MSLCEEEPQGGGVERWVVGGVRDEEMDGVGGEEWRCEGGVLVFSTHHAIIIIIIIIINRLLL